MRKKMMKFYKIFVSCLTLLIALNIVDAKEIIKTHHMRESAVDSTKVKEIKNNKGIGIGPIKKLRLETIDIKLANEGKDIFSDKCSACHSLDAEVEGPALRKITNQVRPEYIMNYLLNTTEMQKKDPQLKALIKKYNGEFMPELELNEPQARALLEYFRSEAK